MLKVYLDSVFLDFRGFANCLVDCFIAVEHDPVFNFDRISFVLLTFSLQVVSKGKTTVVDKKTFQNMVSFRL